MTVKIMSVVAAAAHSRDAIVDTTDSKDCDKCV